MSDNSSDPCSERLNQIIADYLEAVESGESPNPGRLIEQHPELADDLESFLANHDQMNAAREGIEDPTLPPELTTPDAATIPPSKPDTLADDATLPPVVQSQDAPQIGTKVRYFGDYELLEEIARGGMGVVYKARQINLNRTVALKMILAGQLASEDDVKRFYTEAEAAANLDHPGIVPIFEVGEHEGQHYFSMGFVEGESLADKLKDGPLPPREAAEYTKKVAEAIAFAHERGVIHRDLKPANVLLDRDDQPKVTDFGLAKKTDADSNLTGTGQILGTPSYMPPEQAAGKLDEIGPAADVYALGAILYTLLTGRPPFQAANPMDTLLQVLDKDPVSPRQLNPKLPSDLETICLKCLEKEPRRRYDAAAALQEDLRRWLANEPIHARPITVLERTVKWVKRRPLLAALTGVILGLIGLVVMVAIAGFAAVLWQWRIAVAERENTEVSLYFNRIALADRELSAGNYGHAEETLQTCRQDLRQWEWDYLRRVCEADHRTLRGGAFSTNSMAFDLEGRRIVTGHGNGTVKTWNVETGAKLLDIQADGRVAGVAFRPDGRQIAAAVVKFFPRQTALVKTWDAQTGRELTPLRPEADQVLRVAFSPNGKLMVSDSFQVGRQASIDVWDTATGQQIRSLPGLSDTVHPLAFSFSPDSERLAAAKPDGTVKIFAVASGWEQTSFPGHGGRVGALAFSPDGNQLASASGTFAQATVGESAHAIMIWDLTSGAREFTLQGHQGAIFSVAFSPDGQLLASGSQDGTVRIWNARNGEEVRVIHGHAKQVIGVEFNPAGGQLASASNDDTVKLWNLTSDPKGHTVCRHDGAVACVAFSHHSRRLASAGADQSIRIWDAKTGKTLDTLQGHADTVRGLAFSPDDSYLASVSSDRTLRIWELPSGQQIRSIQAHESPILNMAISSDGTFLATAGADNTVAIWDANAGDELHRIGTSVSPCVAFRPGSHRIAVADWNRVVRFFDASNGEELGTLLSQIEGLLSVMFSHDGRRLVLATDKNMVDVWDLPADHRLGNRSRLDYSAFTLDGHTGVVSRAVFSPDDKRIATASHDGTVKIWDALSGLEVLTLRGHAGAVQSVAFSPDGRLLASADANGMVIIWGGTSAKDEEEPGPEKATGASEFSPLGRS